MSTAIHVPGQPLHLVSSRYTQDFPRGHSLSLRKWQTAPNLAIYNENILIFDRAMLICSLRSFGSEESRKGEISLKLQA